MKRALFGSVVIICLVGLLTQATGAPSDQEPTVLCRSSDASGYVDRPKVAPRKCIIFKRGAEANSERFANTSGVRWRWGDRRARGKGMLAIDTAGKVQARFRLTKVVEGCTHRPAFSKLTVRYRIPPSPGSPGGADYQEHRGDFSYRLNTCSDR